MQKINAYRGRVGAPALVRDTSEEWCATSQAARGAADLARTGVTTFHAYYGECKEGSQNEGWYSASDLTTDLDATLEAMFNEGPPPAGEINHYSVMTDPGWKSVACGFATLAGGGYWLTNDYYK